MCLNSKEKKCKVAKEAITCYKVVMKTVLDKMPALVSTIYDFTYEVGESYEIDEGEYFPLKGHRFTSYTAKGRKKRIFYHA